MTYPYSIRPADELIFGIGLPCGGYQRTGRLEASMARFLTIYFGVPPQYAESPDNDGLPGSDDIDVLRENHLRDDQ